MKDIRYLQLMEIYKSCQHLQNGVLIDDFLSVSKYCDKNTILELEGNKFIQFAYGGKDTFISLDVKGYDYIFQRKDIRASKLQSNIALFMSFASVVIALISLILTALQYLKAPL